jgi:uncharacterized protein YciI
MQFLVLGYDGTDEGAKERRLKARPDHIAMGDKLNESGNLWYGAALTDDDGGMIGSMYVVDFASEDELHEWLKVEPYKVGGVWVKTEVKKCQTREPWQFNRPKEFFEERQKQK